jgi:hypothetical protein
MGSSIAERYLTVGPCRMIPIKSRFAHSAADQEWHELQKGPCSDIVKITMDREGPTQHEDLDREWIL